MATLTDSAAATKIEQLCLNISKSNDRTTEAKVLGRLVRWNKDNRTIVRKFGGLQAITEAISSSSRKGDLTAVTSLANTLSFLALDPTNKTILIDPSVIGGGCDICSIVQLVCVQLNQKQPTSIASHYIAPPTNAGVPVQCLGALAKLIWNCSTMESLHLSGATHGAPSLVKLFISETIWCSEQLDTQTTTESTTALDVAAAHFQLLGALWALSVGSDQWSDEQAHAWVALLPTLLASIEKIALLVEEETFLKKRQLCTILMGLVVHVLDADLCCERMAELLHQQEHEEKKEANVFYLLQQRTAYVSGKGGEGSGKKDALDSYVVTMSESNEIGHLCWLALKKILRKGDGGTRTTSNTVENGTVAP